MLQSNMGPQNSGETNTFVDRDNPLNLIYSKQSIIKALKTLEGASTQQAEKNIKALNEELDRVNSDINRITHRTKKRTSYFLGTKICYLNS